MQADKKRIVIIKPGIWNNVKYTKEDIRKAFKKTDWNKAKKIFLDFEEQSSCFVGELRDIKLTKTGWITAIPNFFDKVAKKYYNTGFEVCPKITGEYTKNKLPRLKNSNFDSMGFSYLSAINSDKYKNKRIQFF